MNELARVVSNHARSIVLHARAAGTRGRLIALFLLVALITTAAFSSTSSAKLIDNLIRKTPLQTAPVRHSSTSAHLSAKVEETPTISTDKAQYEPGELITFTGANWSPAEVVTIVLQGDGTEEATTIQATADDAGAFTAIATMPGQPVASAKVISSGAARERSGVAGAAAAESGGSATYTVTATGGASGATAQVQIREGAAATAGAAGDGDDDDPDLPGFMAGKIDKADYLRRRAEHINKLRGIHPGRPVDPGARGRAISEMNRQEGRPNDATSTLDTSNTGTSSSTVTDGALAGALVTASAATSSSVWTAIGPYPLPNGQTFNTNNVAVSGRTVAIAIHPTNSNIAYVGAAQGGVYRTTDGGASWTPIFDNAQSLAIGSIAIAPSQPSTIYVGTGEGNFGCDSFGGVGVYRIDNADGPSPTLTGPLNKDAGGNDVLSGWATGKIIVHPTNPDIIFVGTTTGYAGQNCYPVNDTSSTSAKPRGLFRSTNATQANPTFQRMTVATENSGNRSVSDLEFEPGNPSTLLATVYGFSTAGSGGVYRSTDALSANPTFTRTLAASSTSTSERFEIAVNKVGNQVTVFAASSQSSGTLKRSTDGGVNWTAIGTTGFCGGQCTYDIPIAVDPGNANIVYLGGPGDSGSAHILTKVTNALSTPTFTASQTGLHADEHAIEIDPNNTNIIWAGNDGGIFKSTTAAAAWTSMNNTGYSATQFVSLALHSTDANFTIGGTQDNGTECQGPCGTYTGNTWNQADYGDGGFALIDQSSTSLSSLNMYHTYYNQTSTLIGYAYVTSAANAKFTSSPTSNNWSFSGTGGSASCTTGGGYACTESVEFYMPMALGPGTPNPIYSGTDRLHRSPSPGSSNATVSQTFVSGVPISAVGISPQNDSVRIVGLETGRVFRTMTAQTTGWPEVSGTLPTGSGYYISRAVIDPNNQNTAYVTYSTYFNSSAAHIYKTTNLNATTPTWTGIGTTIPDIPVNAFVVDPADSTRLYAGTDIGVYRSTDGGASWSPFSNGLPRVAVFDMAIQNPNRILRIATHGRGMWEISLNAPVNPGVLQGTVTDSSTNGPISNATVAAGSNTTTTNASGFYQFTNLQPATYSVTASAPGYNTSAAASATVTSNNTTTQNLALTPAPTSGCLTDTSQADFQAGTAASVDLTSTPGSVMLASGAETLDQQQTNTGNSSGLSVSTTIWTGNTFIPATSGKLTKLDAAFFNLANLSGGSVVVEVRTTSGGLPTSTVLATTTFSISGTTSGFYTATFSTPPTLTAGTRYAYVAHTTAGSCAMYRRSNSATDYANGNAVQSTNTASSWATNDPDVAFRTYMSAGYTTSGDLTSSTKDSNPSSSAIPNWTTLSWTATAPAGTTVKFQAAASNSASGPFTFVGPDGTSGTYFTTSGASLSQFNGKRYLKYKAYLSTTSSSATPTLNDVTACYQNGALPATTTAVSSASGTYGGTAALEATLTSGGSPVSGKLITFTLNSNGVGSAVTNASGVATLSNASLSGINAGSYANGVGASFAGDSSYAASSGSGSLTVGKAAPTINWSSPASIVYGTALGATQLNATASVPGSFVYTPATGTVPHAGAQNLHADFTPTDTTNYSAAAKDVSINVTKVGLTIKADDKTRAYGDANPTLTYTMTGFVNGDTQASATSGQPSITTAADGTSAPGAYTITAAVGALTSNDYSFSFVNGTLTVTKADQTISFGALAAKSYGDADFALGATASSGLAVSYAASGKCTVSGATVHLTGAGSCSITASQGGNANYNPAASVSQSFTVNKAGSITNVSVGNATYDGQPHGGTASATGFGGLSQTLTVNYQGRNGTAYGPTTTAPTNAGDYTASASFDGDADHDGSSDSKDYSIAKAAASISLADLGQTYTGSPLAASAVTSPAGLSGLTVTYDGAQTAPTNAGSYAVVASLNNQNYQADNATGTLVIGKATPNVAAVGNTCTYNGSACAGSGTATGVDGHDLGAVTLAYEPGGAAAPINAGSYTVVASIGETANHTAGVSSPASINISKAAPTISVTVPSGPVTYDGNAHAATGFAYGVGGAGDVLSPAVGFTYNGGASEPVNVNTYAVVASFGGNDNYLPATNNSTSITITQAAAEVSVQGYNGTYDGQAHGATGTANGVKGESLSSLLTLGDSFTSAPGGTATWSFAGNTNYAPATGTVNIVIGKANATINVEGYSGVYDGNAHGATGSASGIQQESLNTLLHLGDSFTGVPGGTAHWTFDGDGNYNSSGGHVQIVLSRAGSTTSVTVSNATYDGQPHGGTATVTGANLSQSSTVTYAGRNGTAYGPSTTAPTNAGDYTATASFDGDANHESSSDTKSFTIAKATAAISLSNLNQTYTGSPRSATATTTPDGLSGLTVTYEGATTAPINAGSYAVLASLSNANYQAENATGTLTIGKAAPTISVTVPSGPVTYDGNAHAATGFAYGVGGAGDVLSPAVGFTYNGVADAPLNVNTYAVVASFAGNDNYLPASNNSASIVISKATPTVAITSGLGAFTYDGSAHAATGSVTGVGGAGLGAATITYNGVGVAPVNAGSYTVVASFAGNDNYNQASSEAGNINISKATPSINWSNPADIVYGTALGASQLNAAASVAGGLVYNHVAGTVLNAGNNQTLHVDFTPNDTTNYNGASRDVHISVTKASQTITFNALSNRTYGDAPFTVSASGGASGNPVTFAAAGNCTASGTNGSSITITGAGSCTVTASQGGNDNYSAATDVARSFSIGKATASIALSNLYYLYDGQPHAATATTSPVNLSGLSVTYNGSAAVPTTAGSYAVVATLTNANYTAPNATGTLVINTAPVVRTRNVTVNSDASCTASGAATSVNDGSFDPDGNSGLTITQTPSGPYALGTTTVTLTVKDAYGATATQTATVTVVNPNPVVTITAPSATTVVTKGSTVSFAGAYTDNPGSAYAATWTLKSGTQSITQPGTVNTQTGAISGSYTFAGTGVYLVTLALTDGCGGAGTAGQVGGVDAMVVVYDPSSTGGSVSTTTKAPTIFSLAGAYTANPTLTGTATTGFNASYPSVTAAAPTGQSVFNFTAANLNFSSTSYQWMTVSRPYVWLRGSGTVNNQSGYEFLISAVDGQLTGGGGADKFRIRIWNRSTGAVVYDNQMGAALNAVATTTTSNGDIAIK